MRPSSRGFVIDDDQSRSTFGTGSARGYPQVDYVETASFWTELGWQRHGMSMAWTFDSREDLEAVVRIEFAADIAEEILAGHEGTSVDYAVNVWSRTW